MPPLAAIVPAFVVPRAALVTALVALAPPVLVFVLVVLAMAEMPAGVIAVAVPAAWIALSRVPAPIMLAAPVIVPAPPVVPPISPVMAPAIVLLVIAAVIVVSSVTGRLPAVVRLP